MRSNRIASLLILILPVLSHAEFSGNTDIHVGVPLGSIKNASPGLLGGFGLGFGYFFLPQLSISANAQYHLQPLNMASQTNSNMSYLFLGGRATYYFSQESFSPYVGIALGSGTFKISPPFDSTVSGSSVPSVSKLVIQPAVGYFFNNYHLELNYTTAGSLSSAVSGFSSIGFSIGYNLLRSEEAANARNERILNEMDKRELMRVRKQSIRSNSI